MKYDISSDSIDTDAITVGLVHKSLDNLLWAMLLANLTMDNGYNDIV